MSLFKEDDTPKVKPGEILIVHQKDGNWKGYTNREGQLIEVREIDPYTCLVKVLTHE